MQQFQRKGTKPKIGQSTEAFSHSSVLRGEINTLLVLSVTIKVFQATVLAAVLFELLFQDNACCNIEGRVFYCVTGTAL